LCGGPLEVLGDGMIEVSRRLDEAFAIARVVLL
jgi:hypothetical protein